MWPDRVSNPGPLTYESGALPTGLRGLAVIDKRDYSEISVFKISGVDCFMSCHTECRRIRLYLYIFQIQQINSD